MVLDEHQYDQYAALCEAEHAKSGPVRLHALKGFGTRMIETGWKGLGGEVEVKLRPMA
jgi:hypothetical protein